MGKKWFEKITFPLKILYQLAEERKKEFGEKFRKFLA